MDAYYRSAPPLIVVGDKDSISAKRPLKYIEHEHEEIQRNRASISQSVVKHHTDDAAKA